MKALAYAPLAALIALVGTGAANAATYIFSFTPTTPVPSPFVAGFGQFTTGAGNAITSVSGTVFGPTAPGTITGLSSYAAADNVFYPNSSQLFSFAGFSFAASNNVRYNIFSTGPNAYRVENSVTNPTGFFNAATDTTVTLAVTPLAVPEPTTWALMIAGVGSVGGLMRRRKGRTTVTYA